MSTWDDFSTDELNALVHPPVARRMRIVGTWLVEETDECTGGACGLGYGHEPGCGQEPIVDLSTLPGWDEISQPPKTPRRPGGARTDVPAAAHTTHPTSLKE